MVTLKFNLFPVISAEGHVIPEVLWDAIFFYVNIDDKEESLTREENNEE